MVTPKEEVAWIATELPERRALPVDGLAIAHSASIWVLDFQSAESAKALAWVTYQPFLSASDHWGSGCCKSSGTEMAGSAWREDPKLKASLALEVFACWDQGIHHGNSTWGVLLVDLLLELEHHDRQELNLLVEPERIGRTRVHLRLEGMVQRVNQ